MTRVDLMGTVLATASVPVDLAPRSTVLVPLTDDLAVADVENAEVLVAELGDRRAVRPFVEDVDLALTDPGLRVDVTPAPAGVVVTVSATALARDLVLTADRVDPDAVVDDQLVTLLPGDTHSFHVRTTVGADDPRWQGEHVLRCVNDVRSRTLMVG